MQSEEVKVQSKQNKKLADKGHIHTTINRPQRFKATKILIISEPLWSYSYIASKLSNIQREKKKYSFQWVDRRDKEGHGDWNLHLHLWWYIQ